MAYLGTTPAKDFTPRIPRFQPECELDQNLFLLLHGSRLTFKQQWKLQI